ncbi:uncharacterized protein [Panulirus ornatus]|uniref:uncharacterized protein n=1 Tax=Panulirus ornatus TaxID=150431 RepID=UPI003A870E41
MDESTNQFELKSSAPVEFGILENDSQIHSDLFHRDGHFQSPVHENNSDYSSPSFRENDSAIHSPSPMHDIHSPSLHDDVLSSSLQDNVHFPSSQHDVDYSSSSLHDDVHSPYSLHDGVSSPSVHDQSPSLSSVHDVHSLSSQDDISSPSSIHDNIHSLSSHDDVHSPSLHERDSPSSRHEGAHSPPLHKEDPFASFAHEDSSSQHEDAHSSFHGDDHARAQDLSSQHEDAYSSSTNDNVHSLSPTHNDVHSPSVSEDVYFLSSLHTDVHSPHHERTHSPQSQHEDAHSISFEPGDGHFPSHGHNNYLTYPSSNDHSPVLHEEVHLPSTVNEDICSPSSLQKGTYSLSHHQHVYSPLLNEGVSSSYGVGEDVHFSLSGHNDNHPPSHEEAHSQSYVQETVLSPSFVHEDVHSTSSLCKDEDSQHTHYDHSISSLHEAVSQYAVSAPPPLEEINFSPLHKGTHHPSNNSHSPSLHGETHSSFFPQDDVYSHSFSENAYSPIYSNGSNQSPPLHENDSIFNFPSSSQDYDSNDNSLSSLVEKDTNDCSLPSHEDINSLAPLQKNEHSSFSCETIDLPSSYQSVNPFSHHKNEETSDSSYLLHEKLSDIPSSVSHYENDSSDDTKSSDVEGELHIQLHMADIKNDLHLNESLPEIRPVCISDHHEKSDFEHQECDTVEQQESLEREESHLTEANTVNTNEKQVYESFSQEIKPEILLESSVPQTDSEMVAEPTIESAVSIKQKENLLKDSSTELTSFDTNIDSLTDGNSKYLINYSTSNLEQKFPPCHGEIETYLPNKSVAGESLESVIKKAESESSDEEHLFHHKGMGLEPTDSEMIKNVPSSCDLTQSFPVLSDNEEKTEHMTDSLTSKWETDESALSHIHDVEQESTVKSYSLEVKVENSVDNDMFKMTAENPSELFTFEIEHGYIPEPVNSEEKQTVPVVYPFFNKNLANQPCPDMKPKTTVKQGVSDVLEENTSEYPSSVEHQSPGFTPKIKQSSENFEPSLKIVEESSVMEIQKLTIYPVSKEMLEDNIVSEVEKSPVQLPTFKVLDEPVIPSTCEDDNVDRNIHLEKSTESPAGYSVFDGEPDDMMKAHVNRMLSIDNDMKQEIIVESDIFAESSVTSIPHDSSHCLSEQRIYKDKQDIYCNSSVITENMETPIEPANYDNDLEINVDALALKNAHRTHTEPLISREKLDIQTEPFDSQKHLLTHSESQNTENYIDKDPLSSDSEKEMSNNIESHGSATPLEKCVEVTGSGSDSEVDAHQHHHQEESEPENLTDYSGSESTANYAESSYSRLKPKNNADTSDYDSELDGGEDSSFSQSELDGGEDSSFSHTKPKVTQTSKFVSHPETESSSQKRTSLFSRSLSSSSLSTSEKDESNHNIEQSEAGFSDRIPFDSNVEADVMLMQNSHRFPTKITLAGSSESLAQSGNPRISTNSVSKDYQTDAFSIEFSGDQYSASCFDNRGTDGHSDSPGNDSESYLRYHDNSSETYLYETQLDKTEKTFPSKRLSETMMFDIEPDMHDGLQDTPARSCVDASNLSLSVSDRDSSTPGESYKNDVQIGMNTIPFSSQSLFQASNQEDTIKLSPFKNDSQFLDEPVQKERTSPFRKYSPSESLSPVVVEPSLDISSQSETDSSITKVNSECFGVSSPIDIEYQTKSDDSTKEKSNDHMYYSTQGMNGGLNSGVNPFDSGFNNGSKPFLEGSVSETSSYSFPSETASSLHFEKV